MVLSSVSTAYGSAAAARSPTICMAPTADQTDAAQPAPAPPPKHRHPMRDAIMAGLEALGVANPGASTRGSSSHEVTTSSATAASVAGAPDQAPPQTKLTEAVMNFMHALGQAVRGESNHTPSDDAAPRGADRADRLERSELRHDRRVERREERRVERREERRAEWHDGHGTPAYSDVADRLEALATAIRAHTHTQTSDPAPSTPAISGPSAATSSASVAQTTTEVKTEAAPLLDAFGNLLAALKRPADSGSTLKDAGAQLADFLHQLSQRLAPSADASSRIHAGMLIDVTA
jgi:hypothetical protein